MLNVLKAMILGIVEGITEWLPVSSSAHLVLIENIIKMEATQEFKTLFEIFIQLGAILAVCVLYFNKLNPFSKKKTKVQKMNTWILWFKVAVASVPAAVIGLIFNDWNDAVMGKPLVISVILVLFGVIFILVENKTSQKEPKVKRLIDIDYKLALTIGFIQVIAMLLPGASRSGVTIIGGLLLGMARPVIAEFTFFMSIPVMFGASFLKLLFNGLNFTGSELLLLIVGFLSAFIVSILAISFFIGYIKRKNFKAFGWYRIIAGTFAFLYYLLWAA